MRGAFSDLDSRHLMAQPAFRRYLLHIYAAAGISIPANGADTALLSYREGQRSLGLELIRHAARGLPRRSIEQVLVTVLSEATPQETEDDDRGDDSHDRQ